MENERNLILEAKTPYSTLLLETSATPEEAKYQYFKLVKKYTPEIDEEIFRVIRRAYEDLKDPSRKAAADVLLFTASSGRVRFAGINTSTASQVKLNRALADFTIERAKDPAVGPALVEFLKQRALLLSKNKKWTEALKDLDTLEEIEGQTEEIKQNRVFILNRVALKLANRGHYAEAGHRWRRIHRLDPQSGEILHNLAVCATLLLSREDEDRYWVETLRAWHTELSLKGDDVYLKNLIVETHKRFGGRYLNQTGDENLRAQIAQDQLPADLGPHAMGERTDRRGDEVGGDAPLMPKSVGPPKALPTTPEGKALDAIGRQSWKEAIGHFEEHLKDNPGDGKALDKLAWATLHSGQGNKAFSIWLKMLQEGPEPELGKESYIKAKLDTARGLRERRMFNPAMVQLKDVLKNVPDSKEILVALGEIYKDRQDWSNALYYYEKVLEIDQNDKEVRFVCRQLKTKSRSVRAIM